MIFEVLSFLINLELRHFMFVDHCHVCITFTTSLGRILFSRGLPIGCWCAICIYTIFFFIVICLWSRFTEGVVDWKIGEGERKGWVFFGWGVGRPSVGRSTVGRSTTDGGGNYLPFSFDILIKVKKKEWWVVMLGWTDLTQRAVRWGLPGRCPPTYHPWLKSRPIIPKTQ